MLEMFPTLAKIASGVLVVLATIVASESALNVGGWFIDGGHSLCFQI